jgi:hypothetical protein
MAQLVRDRLYRGERRKDSIRVTVHVSPGDSRELGAEGAGAFDWGRPTAGAQLLAAALLRDALGGEANRDLAMRFYHAIVVQLPFVEPWVLWRREIQAWAQGAAEATASG